MLIVLRKRLRNTRMFRRIAILEGLKDRIVYG